MKDLQLAYLAMIDAEMDGPLSMFNSHGFGTWGARVYYNQPRSEAPVWDAWLTYIEGIAGPLATAPRRSSPAPYSVVQRPSGGMTLFTLLGQRVPLARGEVGRPGVTMSAISVRQHLPVPGIYGMPSGGNVPVFAVRQ